MASYLALMQSATQHSWNVFGILILIAGAICCVCFFKAMLDLPKSLRDEIVYFSMVAFLTMLILFALSLVVPNVVLAAAAEGCCGGPAKLAARPIASQVRESDSQDFVRLLGADVQRLSWNRSRGPSGSGTTVVGVYAALDDVYIRDSPPKPRKKKKIGDRWDPAHPWTLFVTIFKGNNNSKEHPSLCYRFVVPCQAPIFLNHYSIYVIRCTHAFSCPEFHRSVAQHTLTNASALKHNILPNLRECPSLYRHRVPCHDTAEGDLALFLTRMLEPSSTHQAHSFSLPEFHLSVKQHPHTNASGFHGRECLNAILSDEVLSGKLSVVNSNDKTCWPGLLNQVDRCATDSCLYS